MIRFQISALAAVLVCCAPSRLAVSDVDRYRAQSAQPYRNTVDVGDVDVDPMVEAMGGFMRLASEGKKEVTLRIDSHGGGIFLGLKWMRLMEDVKKANGVHVTCIVDGMAASMAAVILESPLCDTRLATSRSMILFHNGSAGVQGNAEEMRQAVAFLEALNTAMAQVVSARLGISAESYRARIAHGDWPLAMPEALEANVIDGVVSPADIAPPVP